METTSKKLEVVEKLMTEHIKNVYEITYFVDENITGESPSNIKNTVTVLGQDHDRAIRAAKKHALTSTSFEDDLEKEITVKYSNFELSKFELICVVDLYG